LEEIKNPMETILHSFGSINFFPVLINAFPSIVHPLLHGFQSLAILIFTSFSHLVTLNPGLISGTIFMTLGYLLYATVSRLRRIRVPHQL